MAEPDLSAELDDAELLINGEVAEVRTEWGVRYRNDDGYFSVHNTERYVKL